MKTTPDKNVIEHWLRLYNHLTGSTFRVTDWPDKDSSKKNVDATCADSGGATLAIEHTLIEPFLEERGDRVQFMETLATLEHSPALAQTGWWYSASLPVGSVPNGIDWTDVPKELLKQLPGILPGLPEGNHLIPVSTAKWAVNLHVSKRHLSSGGPGKFHTARVYPGDPGAELVMRALRKKAPKLAVADGDRKLLLLEQDSVAGWVPDQFEKVRGDPETNQLLAGVDEVWLALTAILESEGALFTSRIMPFQSENNTYSSLNVRTGEFWRA